MAISLTVLCALSVALPVVVGRLLVHARSTSRLTTRTVALMIGTAVANVSLRYLASSRHSEPVAWEATLVAIGLLAAIHLEAKKTVRPR
jgi:hypothetical protein